MLHSEAVYEFPSGWEDVFEEARNEIDHVSTLLQREEKKYDIFPLPHEIYNAFVGLTPEDVKVVIVGQDPYPNVNLDGTPQANGMAFSTRPGQSPPRSLNNIFKEIKTTNPDFNIPSSGYLGPWRQQGVLLLNRCLTVRHKQPESHKQLWFGVLQRVITAICSANPNCIFVMWGKKAQEISSFLGNRTHVLKAAHPSPLSAPRGFFGCGHFQQINDILASQEKAPIDWKL